MRIHILGIGGTFMGGIAALAQESGHVVSGSDQILYPPMSTQLAERGILVYEGYEPHHVDETIECVIVGNVIRRGNPLIESIMNRGIPFVSGPEWLYEHVLKYRHVLAVAGTHGKTTTTALLAHLLSEDNLSPGFLVGGVPIKQQVSAQLGSSPFFVIEADEYDSAFFDKRSKFIHYRPKTLILNNLEYDHADIFPNLGAIQQQFHYLLRTIPSNGLIIRPYDDVHLTTVLQQGCWTPEVTFGGEQGDWRAEKMTPDGGELTIWYQGQQCGQVRWNLFGDHNIKNALAALAAAHHVGVPIDRALVRLSEFAGVKRRMEVRGCIQSITVYDDFAHHPTAIATTLAGLRARQGNETRIFAVVDPGSFTMRTGVHGFALPLALKDADYIICRDPSADWDVSELFSQCVQPVIISKNIDDLVSQLIPILRAGDHVVVMSNTGFGGFHQKLLDGLKSAA